MIGRGELKVGNDTASCYKWFGAMVREMYDFMHSFQFTEYTNDVSTVDAHQASGPSPGSRGFHYRLKA
jgi:hypothetical protein